MEALCYHASALKTTVGAVKGAMGISMSFLNLCQKA